MSNKSNIPPAVGISIGNEINQAFEDRYKEDEEKQYKKESFTVKMPKHMLMSSITGLIISTAMFVGIWISIEVIVEPMYKNMIYNILGWLLAIFGSVSLWTLVTVVFALGDYIVVSGEELEFHKSFKGNKEANFHDVKEVERGIQSIKFYLEDGSVIKYKYHRLGGIDVLINKIEESKGEVFESVETKI